jgi:N-acetylglucosamine-6-phosphate deacetylase
MLLRACNYATGQRIDVCVENGLIRDVKPADTERPDAEAEWIAPAWFDIQINGAQGISFTSAALTMDRIAKVVTTCRSRGIGRFCPTVVTSSFTVQQHSLRTLASACAQGADLAPVMPCIHLEGPYLSPEGGPRGAHPLAHVRPPDLDEFRRLQDAAEGRIRLVTLAPELPGAITFIEKLVSSGIVVAIGHTAANAGMIKDAVRAGARLSTHLGNGTHAVMPRHENYVWEQLGEDRLWASLICDGAHLPPAVARSMLRVKTPNRTILTCDASPLAGLPPGIYREWDQEFEILPEGKIVLSGTTYLGGSWDFTDSCIGNVIRFVGVSLRDAVDMATVRPHELLGLPAAALEAGNRTPLVLFDWRDGGDLRVKRVVG